MKHRIIHLTLLSAALLTLSSCQRIPLYDAQSGVFVKLDFAKEIQVRIDEDFDLDARADWRRKTEVVLPEHVRACFFDAVSHELTCDVFLPAKGGFVNVEPGNYDLLVYSLGSEASQVSGGDSRGGAYAFTSSTGSKVKASKTKRGSGGDEDTDTIENEIIFEPDHLYSGKLPAVFIPVRSDQQEPVLLEVQMHPVEETWTFVARNVVGAENIRKAVVYMSGQVPGKYLWDGRFPSRVVAVPLDCAADGEKHRLFSVFNTFGKHPVQESHAILVLTTPSGVTYQWVFDVTDQFDNPDNDGHQIIVDDLIQVPDGTGPGGGLDPHVYDWVTEIIDVPLN